jgi:hypothetical protein
VKVIDHDRLTHNGDYFVSIDNRKAGEATRAAPGR